MREDYFEEFAIEYFNFYLKLRDIYLKNEIYGSVDLYRVFHELNHNYEIEYYNYSGIPSDKENIIKNIALFELKKRTNPSNELLDFEEKVEKVISVINTDIYSIYKNKTPVKRFYE